MEKPQVKPNRLREIAEGMTPKPFEVVQYDGFYVGKPDYPQDPASSEADAIGMATLANLRFAIVELVEVATRCALPDTSEEALKYAGEIVTNGGDVLALREALAKIAAYEE